ncbi:MAG TPA: ATP-binding cassette domain-containing protein [Bosea sp. (in: a-proteobacteria)]|jgi:iron complex transport system ATP-binding protein|uniref:ABC transporter ATP-binding protein n=1 Tax=Bosea sp. (in: a-proteobacteria) TaxID=1871050 RepID=UPI002E0EE8CF|nr:ATP-binding cassette domain-containing protein [Bosea sp. (in: a-proteobacteria)]
MIANGTLDIAKEAVFDLQGAGFDLGSRTLLRPLDLALAPGRCYGLIGPNGSGKSTLVKLLARQLTPTRGEIRFRGQALAQWGARPFARELGYLPQLTPATDGMLVEELVALGRYPWHGPLGRFAPRDRAKVAEAMALTQVDVFKGRPVDSLSGGERQRVWLAMLLAQDAGCLLLDEPTSALDIAHQNEVLAVVREMTVNRAMTTLVVLHDVNMAARYCDEIIALGQGSVVARGKPSEIMTPGRLEQIYGVRMGVTCPDGNGRAIGYVL